MKKLILSVSLLASTIAFAQESPKSDTLKSQRIETVTMTKKVFQKKADRLVYDVANSPIAKGNTAFSLLKETPLVSSTDDKTLKISGKSNAVIYINGKKSLMNADALEAMLKNTPAENIQKIEVITLPGSEYNVESSDGIINIILKKKMTDGVSGNLRFSNTQHKYNDQSAFANLTARKGKFGFDTNISLSNRIWPQSYNMSNGNATARNISTGTVENKDVNFGGYLNMDYAVSDKQNIGLSYNYWDSKTPYLSSNFFNIVEYRDLQNVVQRKYNRSQNSGSDKSNNQSVNLNYEWKFDEKDGKINLNTAYLHYNKQGNNHNSTDATDALGNFQNILSQFNQNAPQIVDNFSATADFTKNFGEIKFGAGGNFNKTKTDNDTYFENLNLLTNSFVKDENQSNHFVYDEKISGIYANVEWNFGEKISAKIGLRLEFTNSFGEILDRNVTVDRNYKNLLPSASLNYQISQNHSLSYGFTSRVRRPSFWEINPVRIYLTEVNYIQNNPFVKSASVYNHELMYMYKNSYFLQIQNTTTKDAMQQVPLQKTENGVNTLRYIRTNYGTENNFSVNLGMNKSFFKGIWNANYAVGLQINSYKGSVDTDPITGEKFDAFIFNNSLVSPFIHASNNIRLSPKKDWWLGLNYFYLGKSRQELGEMSPLQQMDISLKKIWNDWTFTLDLKDVFQTMNIKINDVQPSGNFNFLDMKQQGNSRRVILGITYNFGNKKIQKVRQIDSAVEDIKSRTGGK